jgi:ketol-acid reductoisomerase
VITEETRAAMRKILDAIQDGSFAREWLAENRAGRLNFERLRQQDRNHEIERVGAQLRAMMPWSEEGKRGSAEAGKQGGANTPESAEKSAKPGARPRRPAHPLPR